MCQVWKNNSKCENFQWKRENVKIEIEKVFFVWKLISCLEDAKNLRAMLTTLDKQL